MEDEAPHNESSVKYEESRTEAKRAQLGLNILVVLSAVAGAAFFAYVLATINPWRNGDRPGINVPTSTVAERLGVLEGEDINAGLFVIVRDIDEAPEYRDTLSEQMRADLGIEDEGRLYLVIIRNHSDTSVQVRADELLVTDKGGMNWELMWLDELAEPGSASAVGRMRLAQSGHEFDLPPTSERQLYVFAPADSKAPPSAEAFRSGELRLRTGDVIPLEHTEVKVAEQ